MYKLVRMSYFPFGKVQRWARGWGLCLALTVSEATDTMVQKQNIETTAK
jgi:hypothetical protein